MKTEKDIQVSGIIDKAHALGKKEALKKILPTDEEVTQWWDENDINSASASSAIYKFRVWLKDRSKS